MLAEVHCRLLEERVRSAEVGCRYRYRASARSFVMSRGKWCYPSQPAAAKRLDEPTQSRHVLIASMRSSIPVRRPDSPQELRDLDIHSSLFLSWQAMQFSPAPAPFHGGTLAGFTCMASEFDLFFSTTRASRSHVDICADRQQLFVAFNRLSCLQTWRGRN